MPSLYPSYFPYSAQHSVLLSIQQVLEECCYDFTKKWLPSEVEKHEWDCAAAMELSAYRVDEVFNKVVTTTSP